MARHGEECTSDVRGDACLQVRGQPFRTPPSGYHSRCRQLSDGAKVSTEPEKRDNRSHASVIGRFLAPARTFVNALDWLGRMQLLASLGIGSLSAALLAGSLSAVSALPGWSITIVFVSALMLASALSFAIVRWASVAISRRRDGETKPPSGKKFRLTATPSRREVTFEGDFGEEEINAARSLLFDQQVRERSLRLPDQELATLTIKPRPFPAVDSSQLPPQTGDLLTDRSRREESRPLDQEVLQAPER